VATSGDHRTEWSGRSDDGTPLSRGVYFVRLETTAGALSRNVVLLGH
jgi:flagellar hook assembly protein FlgD